MNSKLWGGRFENSTHPAVEEFTHSFSIDVRLWEADLQGSIAHAQMLGKTGILSESESATLVEGLRSIREERVKGSLIFSPQAEDIHSEIERLLSERIGELSGKLHTGRSRNDQVATATRIYLRQQIRELQKDIRALQKWIIQESEKNLDCILPGFTHLQHAQPVSLAHHLMAYFWMFERDHERLQDCLKRLNTLPLGSAALAGTSFPIDRNLTAQILQFDRIAENSLDAVSDRDFIVEFLAATALIMTHLSKWAEEWILWSTPEFGYLEMDDTVTTGSSIMPQKKNPDCAELIRGKVGRVNGALMGALTLLKGLPLAYNRDLQEDKVLVFEGLDTTRACLQVMLVMLQATQFKKERMASVLQGDFSNATDLADDLVRQGKTFRQAHTIVGKIVRTCIQQSLRLEDLTLDQLRAFCPEFSGNIRNQLQPIEVLKARTSMGGTSPASVQSQIQTAQKQLER